MASHMVPRLAVRISFLWAALALAQVPANQLPIRIGADLRRAGRRHWCLAAGGSPPPASAAIARTCRRGSRRTCPPA